jgi:hypothetical protein
MQRGPPYEERPEPPNHGSSDTRWSSRNADDAKRSSPALAVGGGSSEGRVECSGSVNDHRHFDPAGLPLGGRAAPKLCVPVMMNTPLVGNCSVASNAQEEERP